MPTTAPQYQSPRWRQSVTIASATSISALIPLLGYRVAALDMSSGWDAANRMTFSVSPDGTSFFDLYDDIGTEWKIASGAPLVSATARAIVPNSDLALALAAHDYFKIRSGPSTAAVNLTTGVTIDVILMPL